MCAQSASRKSPHWPFAVVSSEIVNSAMSWTDAVSEVSERGGSLSSGLESSPNWPISYQMTRREFLGITAGQ